MSLLSSEYLRRTKKLLENPNATCTELSRILLQEYSFGYLKSADMVYLIATLLDEPRLREKLMGLLAELIERRWYEDPIAIPGTHVRIRFLFDILMIAERTKPDGKLLISLRTLKTRNPEILKEQAYYLTPLIFYLDRAVASSTTLIQQFTP